MSVPEYFVHLVGAAPGLPGSIVTGTTRIPPVGPSPNAPVDDTTPPPHLRRQLPAVPGARRRRCRSSRAGPPHPVLRHRPVGHGRVGAGAVRFGDAPGGPALPRRDRHALDRVGRRGGGTETVQVRPRGQRDRPRGRCTAGQWTCPVRRTAGERTAPGRADAGTGPPRADRGGGAAHRRGGHLPRGRVAAGRGDPGAVALSGHDRALLDLHPGLGRQCLGPRRPRRRGPRGVEHSVGGRDHPCRPRPARPRWCAPSSSPRGGRPRSCTAARAGRGRPASGQGAAATA